MKKLLFLALPLAICMTACKEKKVDGDNPFLTKWDTPFGVPPFEKIRTEHYMPAFEHGMKLQMEQIDSIVKNTAAPDFDNTILAYDNSGAELDRTSRVFNLLCSADTNPEMQKIQEKIAPLLASHSDSIMMNGALFARIKAIYDNRAALGDSLKIRLTDKIYKDFVRSGALLDASKKAELRELNQQLAATVFHFSSNLLADNEKFVMLLDNAEDLAGLPDNVISAAAETAKAKGHEGKWAFTLEKPSWIPFLTSSPRRDLRQKLYEGYLNRCNYGDSLDNKHVINEIIALRTKKAQLLGFSTYADYVLADRMAKTPANVYDLLDALWTPALKGAKAELDEMKPLMAADGLNSNDFQSWDWWYYAEKVRKAKYDLDEEMIKPYLSLDNVRTGVFTLCNRLYGITFRPVNVPLYNKDCVVFEVLDRDQASLGVIYLDFFTRSGAKAGGAWCDEFRSQSYENGKKVLPVVSIVCNFPRPVGEKPSLLSLDEAETFFHEFGHALQAFFSDVHYKGLHDMERDFVELPSQIMESWAFEPAMLRQYATNYATGEVIPDFLIQKIENSKFFNQGFTTVEYLAASISDMEIHSRPTADTIDVNAFERQVLNEKRGLIPQIAPRYRYPYFSHIFDGGYAVGYYGYIWSEVMARDAYQAFVDSGDIFNPDIATKFRKEVLARGGEYEGAVLYRNFRGQEPSRDPLLRKRGLLPPVVKLVPLTASEVPAPGTTVMNAGPERPQNPAPHK